MQLAWKVEAGSNVKLQDYDPSYVDEHTDPAYCTFSIRASSCSPRFNNLACHSFL